MNETDIELSRVREAARIESLLKAKDRKIERTRENVDTLITEVCALRASKAGLIANNHHLHTRVIHLKEEVRELKIMLIRSVNSITASKHGDDLIYRSDVIKLLETLEEKQ